MFNIWIIEDDPANRFVYQESLSDKYQFNFFETLAQFKNAILNASPDLLIADLRLPDESFLTYLSTRPLVLSEFPVIVISSMDELQVLQDCFIYGVEDFLTKPFNTNALLAKIEKIKKEYYLGRFKFHDLKQSLILSNKLSVQFTPKEYHILKILSSSPKMTLDREQIKSAVWKELELSGNAVDVHMYAIRKKIKPHGLSIEFVDPNFFKLVFCPPVTQ